MGQPALPGHQRVREGHPHQFCLRPAFFRFGGLSVVALAYFQRPVPETRNRSLQAIERDLDLPSGAMESPSPTGSA